jgi:hypothetical protein
LSELLKQHPSKDSIVMKRRGCGWSDDFLLEVLPGQRFSERWLYEQIDNGNVEAGKIACGSEQGTIVAWNRRIRLT